MDEAVVHRLIRHVGGQLGTVYGKNGKAAVLDKLNGYSNAGRHSPWLVLIDLDNDTDCAPPARAAWLPETAPHLCFRIAVREVEAWLMADAETLAGYLSIARSRVPTNVESLDSPKTTLVNLARNSRSKIIRKEMVPRQGSGRQVGVAYASRLIEYVETMWQPAIAARNSESLYRAIRCLCRLAANYEEPKLT